MIRELSGFSQALVVGGALLAGVVAFDLVGRGLHRTPPEPPISLPDSDPARGRRAILDHGCGACHRIAGVRGATGRVGPPLDDFRHQMYVAGVLPNTPENVARWIASPREINPQTAMPDLDVTEQEARDIAVYLYRSR